MSVVKVIEIMSDSTSGWEDAAKTGIERASRTLKNIRSAWVKGQSLTVDGNGTVTSYRVTLKLTFELE